MPSSQAASSDALEGKGIFASGSCLDHPDDPPRLYAVVDAAAEPGPTERLDQSSPGFDAIAAQDQAQAIFDTFGLRPVYLVDLAAASQAESYEPLRTILERHACAIGVHLPHSSLNPPFEGSDPEELQERMLRALVSRIQTNLHVSPLFFRAGGYDLGPRTLELLAQLGFAVDFSIPPPADPAVARVPRVLARLGVANPVTLTPDGGTASEQIRLVRTMAGRGSRVFTLHCRSPSRLAGHTPQVSASADLRRIEAICRFFFEELGGMPGNPADLVPQQMRECVWPGRTMPDMALPGAVTRPSRE